MTYRKIQGYENFYKISDTGEVVALERKVKMPQGGFKIIKEHKPKISDNHKGYLKVMLTDHTGKRKGHFVHRLVGKAFIKNSKADILQINHKDKNKKNNCVLNLEWVTNRENSIHRIDKTKTSSKYFGVTRNRNRWQALIRVNGKVLYLGLFKDEEKANEAVKKACNTSLESYAHIG